MYGSPYDDHLCDNVPDEEDYSPNCKWTVDDVGGDSTWETQCGHVFEWTTGGPKENGAKFCLYCGKTLVEVFSSELSHEEQE